MSRGETLQVEAFIGGLLGRKMRARRQQFARDHMIAEAVDRIHRQNASGFEVEH